MRCLLIALVALVLGCSSQASFSQVPLGPPPEGFTRFATDGGSLGVAPDALYFVIVDERLTDHDLRRRVSKYTSYILTYRGLTETFAADLSDYYLLVNFSADPASNSQTFELTAASAKVYEATKQVKPRWYASSIHYGAPLPTEDMLAMHVLAVRDFVGGNPNSHQVSASFRSDSELVKSLKNEVGP